MFEKFAQSTSFFEPLGGGSFAAGGTHSANNIAKSLGPLTSVEASIFEDLRNLKFLEGLKGNMFSPTDLGLICLRELTSTS